MAEKTYLIVNRRSGKALQATGLDNGLVVEQSAITYRDSQLWSQRKTKDGIKLINKGADKALDLMQGGTDNGTWTQTWQDAEGESQYWTITASASRGYKKITSIMAGKVLDIQDLSEEDGSAAQIWEDVGGENQEWKITEYPVPEKKPTVKKATKKAETLEKSEVADKTTKPKKAVAKKSSKKSAAKKESE